MTFGRQLVFVPQGEVGGVGFVGGRQEAPIRVLVGTRSQAPGGVDVISAPSRPGLLARLAARFRRPR
jgi:hypothetical protein